jgi:trk system potassium uptake protein TrkH
MLGTDRLWLARSLGDRARWRPTAVQLFVGSFLGLILVGWLGLLVLPGLYTGPRLGPVDALFTATSAVCVTGLIVVDTATYFTRWGQVWLLFLIQLGGLGLLTLTTLVIRLIGRRTGLGVEAAAVTAAGEPGFQVRAVFIGVVGVTAVLEAAGAAGLWLLWRDRLGDAGAAWPAVFHAVSAFCNAGFSIFSTSLVEWRMSAATLALIAVLLVVGGLGLPVIDDLRERYVRRTRRRLEVHARLALATTFALAVGATVVFFVFERAGTFADLGVVDSAANAAFMALTPRTTGFNTVDYDVVSNPSLVLTIGLMIIGGSPGSTAGGIKTTTFAVLLLVFVARLRGSRTVTAFGRTIPEQTVQRAIALSVGAIALLGGVILALMITEGGGAVTNRVAFARIVFEAHSAFGTVGLSMGETPELSPAGRVIITAVMFIGRVGPMSLAAAMAAAGRRVRYRYAREDVVVG